MNYQQALDWIHSRLKFNCRPGLIRISALLEMLDQPQNKIPTVHVGGTNGKGSTVTFLRSLLETQGLKVGTFTSPYVECFNERVAINGQPIADQDLLQHVIKIKPLVEQMDQDETLKHMTEFEIITAIGFCHFYQEQVDIALIEVGLGGTYDSTNVITPELSIITTIGMDHMDILGHSIVNIASQKAGIIKPGVPLVMGHITGVPLETILAVANEKGSSVYRYGQSYTAVYYHPTKDLGELFDFHSTEFDFPQLTSNMLGQHQVENASTAIQAYIILAKTFGYAVKKRDIQAGLSHAFWPGRMEILSKEPFIMIDGAHNEPAVERLVENVKQTFKERPIHIIFGALTTKEIDPMIEQLATIPQVSLRFTEFDFPKARICQDYQSFNYQCFAHWQQALADVMIDISQDDVIIITGSLYFISQVREYLLNGGGSFE